MKKLIALLLGIIIIAALFASCGGDSSLKGKFVNPDDSEDWIEFKSGNKVTTSHGGFSYNGKFSVDGNKVILKMTFLGIENEEEYILSDDGKTLVDQSWLGIEYIKK